MVVLITWSELPSNNRPPSPQKSTISKTKRVALQTMQTGMKGQVSVHLASKLQPLLKKQRLTEIQRDWNLRSRKTTSVSLRTNKTNIRNLRPLQPKRATSNNPQLNSSQMLPSRSNLLKWGELAKEDRIVTQMKKKRKNISKHHT